MFVRRFVPVIKIRLANVFSIAQFLVISPLEKLAQLTCSIELIPRGRILRIHLINTTLLLFRRSEFQSIIALLKQKIRFFFQNSLRIFLRILAPISVIFSGRGWTHIRHQIAIPHACLLALPIPIPALIPRGTRPRRPGSVPNQCRDVDQSRALFSVIVVLIGALAILSVVVGVHSQRRDGALFHFFGGGAVLGIDWVFFVGISFVGEDSGVGGGCSGERCGSRGGCD
mmetsp:Transcript_2396/g.4585  ORF Transcript_2396/g.4585 Transcript_2396/m.4585 type:complete len:228 (-) Transcript_2396:224-907(-)